MIAFTQSDHPVVAGFDPDEYHAFGAVDKERVRSGDITGLVMSRSALWEFARHPSRWIRTRDDREETDAMAFGTLMDNRVLMPDRFNAKFVRQPETYPAEVKTGPAKGTTVQKPFNLNSNWCSDWRDAAKAQGKIPVDFRDWASADSAVSRLNEEPGLADLITASRRSVFIVVNYRDKATGITLPFKVLVDVLPPVESDDGDKVLDYKTAHSADEVKWTRHVFDMGYHYQGAGYLAAVNCAIPSPNPRTMFGHIISETSPPFEPALRLMSAEFLELGANQFARDLELFCQCVANRHWPGYQESKTRYRLGRWAFTEPAPWMQNAAYEQTFETKTTDEILERV